MKLRMNGFYFRRNEVIHIFGPRLVYIYIHIYIQQLGLGEISWNNSWVFVLPSLSTAP